MTVLINCRYVYIQPMPNCSWIEFSSFCPVCSTSSEMTVNSNISHLRGEPTSEKWRGGKLHGKSPNLLPHLLLPGERKSLLPVNPEPKLHPWSNPEITRQYQGQIKGVSRIWIQACDVGITCRISVLHLNSLTSTFVKYYHISIRMPMGQQDFSIFVSLLHPYMFKDSKWPIDCKHNLLFVLHRQYSSYSFIL